MYHDRIMTLILSLFGDYIWFKEMFMHAKLSRDRLAMVNLQCVSFASHGTKMFGLHVL